MPRRELLGPLGEHPLRTRGLPAPVPALPPDDQQRPVPHRQILDPHLPHVIRLAADQHPAPRAGVLGGDLHHHDPPHPQRRQLHRHPGHVLRDLAVMMMLADGGDCLSDLAVLREQSALFGDVASTATAWRTLDAVDEATLNRLRAARAAAREQAWAAGAAPAQVILDLDATLVTAHSEKEGATAHYKHGFGFHPLLCFADLDDDGIGGGALAGILRSGRAGANDVADHITVLDLALAQLPEPWRPGSAGPGRPP